MALSQIEARRIWLKAQRLDETAPFGDGAEATRLAVEHLGYVQIDTINVIERCHHHILFSRIPQYRRQHLAQALSEDKSVFEYWTHALAYVPTRDLPFHLGAMQNHRVVPSRWFGSVTPDEIKAMLKRIKTDGPLSMRDIDDDELVDKNHAWASRKPSKRVLEMAFFQGYLTVSGRQGMLKSYDLIERHFGWQTRGKPATEAQVTAYMLDRALRSQGMVSLESICHLDAPRKKPMKALIDARVKRKQLIGVHLEGAEDVQHWATPEALDTRPRVEPSGVHILSPFDPLIIQRKRLQRFFNYEHVFEAYVPAAKRRIGYFSLPVMVGERVVGAIDLKADRSAKSLLIQNLVWMEPVTPRLQSALDAALDRFAAFQFGA